jgi:hypothetical protein
MLCSFSAAVSHCCCAMAALALWSSSVAELVPEPARRSASSRPPSTTSPPAPSASLRLESGERGRLTTSKFWLSRLGGIAVAASSAGGGCVASEPPGTGSGVLIVATSSARSIARSTGRSAAERWRPMRSISPTTTNMAGRCTGSLPSMAPTSATSSGGVPGATCASDGGGTNMCCAISSPSPSARNGVVPASISNSIPRAPSPSGTAHLWRSGNRMGTAPSACCTGPLQAHGALRCRR